jgi:signal recognition particle subunit SEC65
VNEPTTEFLADIINSVERGAKVRERLAIMEIILEEIRHASSQAELDALDRVAAQIKHRTTQGL